MPDLSSPPVPPSQLRPAAPPFECEVRSSARAATWIRAGGELDFESAPRFEQALRESLSSALLVIIDLRQLTLIDGTGLHVIIEADARARRSRRRLVVVRGPAHIDRLFQLLGLSDRLTIIDLKPILAAAPAPPPPASQHAA